MAAAIEVKIAEPVKLDGRWHRAGDTPEVDPATARLLDRGGFLSETPRDLAGFAGGLPEFEPGVAVVGASVSDAEARHADELSLARAQAAEASAQRDLLGERVLTLQAQVEVLHEDRAAARARADEADAEVRSLQARNHELEAQLSDAAETDSAVAPTAVPKRSGRKNASSQG